MEDNFHQVSSYTVTSDYEGVRLDNCLISKLKGLPRTKIYSTLMIILVISIVLSFELVPVEFIKPYLSLFLIFARLPTFVMQPRIIFVVSLRLPFLWRNLHPQSALLL